MARDGVYLMISTIRLLQDNDTVNVFIYIKTLTMQNSVNIIVLY